MRIVVLDGYAFNPGDLSWAPIERYGELTVYDRTPPELVVERLRGASVAFSNKTRLGEDAFAACPELKFIGMLATGFDVIDIAAAQRHGVVVSNVPGYATNAVAQHAIALLLEICCRVGQHDQAVHAGRWTQAPDYCFWDYPLIELAGKTFGVLGTGAIGCRTAQIAQALGMEIIGCSRRENPSFIGAYVSRDELLTRADVLSLHCAANADTIGVINAAAIARMKPGAILINTARGSLIDSNALAAALNDGRVYAAGVDVSAKEPIAAGDPLLTAKNCILTPHIAWAPHSARERLMRASEENLRAFLAGAPINRVDTGR